MTVGDQPFTESANDDYNVQPVDVRITEDFTSTERVAPDFGSSNTFTLQLAGAAQPVQLLQRRIKRSKARIIITGLSNTFTEITPGNPTAGNGFTYTNNTGVPQTLESIRFTLTTDAVVANRFVFVQIKDTAGNFVWSNFDSAAIVASTTLSVYLAQGIANTAGGASGSTLGGLPSTLQLQPGWSVAIFVSAMDAGDQISSIVLTLTGANTTAIFHNNANVLANPIPPVGVGVQINAAPFQFDWESQQPLYGVGIGGTVQVSVIDETYE
jgi:hypothetical protein